MLNRLLICSVTLVVALSGQTYFTPVSPTGIPYVIVVTAVDVFGDSLMVGSEIAVFDDSLCVGAGLFDGNYNYQFSVWQRDDGQGLAGFTPGAPMIFKLWAPVNQVWQELDCTPSYEAGDGTFGSGIYTVTSLVADWLGTFDSHPILLPTEVSLSAYPNPFNSNIQLYYRCSVANVANVTVYSLTGTSVVHHSVSGSGIINWNGLNKFGKQVPSGVYLIELKTASQQIYQQVTLLK